MYKAGDRGLRTDLLVAALIASATALLCYKIIAFPLPPEEDAAMLMRYAEHWANGYGIVWNIGEPPVDGATDFLYMITLGLLIRAGAPVETASFMLGIGSHALAAAVIYLAVRKIQGSSHTLAVISAAYFSTGAGLWYIQAGFGTPFFALFACIAWCFALLYKEEPARGGYAAGFALSCLLLGLTRPEGVLLALFMLLALIIRLGMSKSKKALSAFAMVFLVLGGAYFLWRWNYFGDPLPNPFYKKGGGHIYPGSLVESAKAVLKFGLPAWPFFALASLSKKGMREAVFALIPVAGFTLIWVLLSREMNYGMRFQYAVLPILLISWPGLFEEAVGNLGPSRKKALVAAAVIFAVAFLSRRAIVINKEMCCKRPSPEGLYTVAKLMRGYGAGGYTVVTTEAGLMPLYSGWKAVDAWGLNDKWIAHHGTITNEYIRSKDPDIIMYHHFPRGSWVGDENSWFSMLKVLDGYARANNYILAADFEVESGEGHVYFVKRDFPDSPRLVEDIRKCRYGSYVEGRPSRNLAE